MTTLDQVALIQAAASWYILGVVTMIELHSYPTFRYFADLSAEKWQAYHHFHTRQLGIIIGGPMIIQLVTAIAWLWMAPQWLVGVNLGLVIVTWLITFAWAVPAHNRLAQSYDQGIVGRLQLANRWRWFAWLGQTGLVSWSWWFRTP